MLRRPAKRKPTALGQRVRDLREGAGFSQEELAQLVFNERSESEQFTRGSVANIENGITRDPKMSTLRDLAVALGTNIDYLVTGQQKAERPIRTMRQLEKWVSTEFIARTRQVVEAEALRRAHPHLRAVAESGEPYGLRKLQVIRMPVADIERLVRGKVAAGQPILIASDDYPADYVYSSPEYTEFSE